MDKDLMEKTCQRLMTTYSETGTKFAYERDVQTNDTVIFCYDKFWQSKEEYVRRQNDLFCTIAAFDKANEELEKTIGPSW